MHGWPEHACIGCSLGADQVSNLAHLNARDTTLVYASRAPQADIARLKARMGWDNPWYTITDSFDADFGVDEWHGHNAFIRDGDRMFRTYFINSRGDEAMGTVWSYLDMTALGRQEEWEDSPEGYPQSGRTSGGTGTKLRSRRRARPEVGRGVGRRRGRVSETRRLVRWAASPLGVEERRNCALMQGRKHERNSYRERRLRCDPSRRRHGGDDRRSQIFSTSRPRRPLLSWRC